MNPKEIEDGILQLCQEYSEGVTYQMLQNTFQSIEPAKIPIYINKLLSKNKIDLLKKADGSFFLKYKECTKSKFQGGNTEENMILKAIEESGPNGIEKKTIRFQTNLNLPTVTKALSALEKRQAISYFNPVAAPKKKLFIIFGVEPNRELLPSVLNDEKGEFDSELILIVSEQCYRFIESKGRDAKRLEGGPLLQLKASLVSVSQVLEYLNKLGIVKDPLTEDHLTSILESLKYDGKLLASNTPSGIAYRAVKSFTDIPEVVKIPCGVCPHVEVCDDVGIYSPASCQYMKEWMEF